ncbi:unnamed protein product, partial [Rotaria socialis]
ELSVKKCEQLIQALHLYSNRVSLEQFGMAVKPIFNTISNILTGVNSVLLDRSKALQRDVTDANRFPDDYDTDLEYFWSNPYLFANGDDFSRETIESNRNLYYQQRTAVLIESKVRSLLKTVTTRISQYLNIGQKFQLNTESIGVTIEKVRVDEVTNKTIEQKDGAEIHLQNFEINENETFVTLTLITLPLATNGRLNKTVQYSRSVSLSLNDKNHNEISVKNLTDPIEVIIPRDKNLQAPPMIPQNVTNLSNNKTYFHFNYFKITHHVNLSTSLHIEILPKNKSIAYFAVIILNSIPDFQTNQIDEWKLFCPQDNGASSFTMFLNNTRVTNHDMAVLGIREVDTSIYCHNKSRTLPWLHDQIGFHFTQDYSLRVFVSGCYYLDENHEWRSDGLIVGPKTNYHHTQCFSSHLTGFGGGLIVVPNAIDWNYAKENAQFERNKTIYGTLIGISGLSILIFIFAAWKDRKDAKKMMMKPLLDNKKCDRYFYQIIVFTGMRNDAGTKSKIHFVLSGDNDETGIRLLDAERPIVERGDIDSLLMAVPRSLGMLNFLRIRHDNSGKGSDASWFLKYVIICDLQTMEKTYFICQRWLAVEKDDGKIERTLSVAGEVEKLAFSYLFSKNIYHNFADNHLWFSIFSYHPLSINFTRVQRCTCCFVFLFLNLLMSIIYYDIQAANTIGNYLTIGPFYFSQEQISIGIAIELILFLPSFLLIALFRRTKVRNSRTVQSIYYNKEYLLPYTKNQKSKFLLPWWCLIIAYILSLVFIGVSITFIIQKSISIGDLKTRKWLTSILVSFISSICLTQPFKVFGLTLFCMCLCRNKRVQDLSFDDDRLISHTCQKSDTNANECGHNKNSSSITINRLNPVRAQWEEMNLEKARHNRLIEIQTWNILREILIVILFLSCLYAITYANRDVENSRMMVKHLRNYLLEDNLDRTRLFSKKNLHNSFEQINTFDEYWSWLKTKFLVRLRAQQWYNGGVPKDLAGYLNDKSNRMIGWASIRQLRVKKKLCSPEIISHSLPNRSCYYEYSFLNEEKSLWKPRWLLSNQSNDDEYSHSIINAFKYRSASELDSYIYATEYNTYFGGGYNYQLRGSLSEIIENLTQLEKTSWLDSNTRAIFLTFNLYNPNVNLFTYCSLLIENVPTIGRLIPRISFQPFKLVQLYTNAELIYCIIYLILVTYYIYIEIRLIVKLRLSYVKHIWSYFNWCIIIFSWTGVGFHFIRQAELKRLGKLFKHSHGYYPINLQFASYLNNLLTYQLGFCCFFATIKLLHLLRFNRRMTLFWLTLQKAKASLAGFALLFSFVFTAFSSLLFLLFHAHLDEFATFSKSAQTCFEMISLDFSGSRNLKNVDLLLAFICLVLFALFVVFILQNMFISIIVDHCNLIRRDIIKEKNQYEMIKFIQNKIFQLFGFNKSKRVDEQQLDCIVEFPQKVDQLFAAFDRAYDD